MRNGIAPLRGGTPARRPAQPAGRRAPLQGDAPFRDWGDGCVQSGTKPVSIQRALVSRGARLQTCRVAIRGDIVRAGSQPVQHFPLPPPPPRKVPHSCKIAPTPPAGNLFFISLSPFLSTPSPASPPERATPPGKMRIETARDTDHRTSPPNFPGQFGLLSASGPGQTLPCSGCDHPPRMAHAKKAVGQHRTRKGDHATENAN